MSQFEASYSPQAFHADGALLNHATILASAIDASYSKAVDSTPAQLSLTARLVQSVRKWRQRNAARAMARRLRIDQVGVSARAMRPGTSAANAPHFSSAA